MLKIYAFAALSLFIGLGSAWSLIDGGAFFNTTQIGPWQYWNHEGRLDADPYTRARTARSGRLPITSGAAFYFTATQDSDGDDLSAECDYEIIGRPFNALWWSVTLYDGAGGRIQNKAERHAFNSKNIALLPDGGFQIRLAPTARPGNWLPTGEGGDLLVMLRILKPQNLTETDSGRPRPELMPRIRKVDC